MKSENKCSLLRKFSSYSDGGCYAKIIFLEGRAPSSLWGGGDFGGFVDVCGIGVVCNMEYIQTAVGSNSEWGKPKRRII